MRLNYQARAALWLCAAILTAAPTDGAWAKAKKPAPYECRRAMGEIVIDGKPDEPAWKQAPSITFYLPVTLREPISKTEARILWDDRFLYVAYRAHDKDIWGYYTERDSPTYEEDVLEFFAVTDPLKEPHYFIEINPLGTVLDGLNIKRGAGDARRWPRWNCTGLKVGITVDGTLNDYSDKDNLWQLEIAIPFADLPTLDGKVPQAGDRWLFNLARYDYSVYLPEGMELSASSPLTRVDFHRMADYRTLVFEGGG